MSETEADRIAELIEMERELHEKLRAVRVELDSYRVRCPACRCRIIPGIECECCRRLRIVSRGVKE